MSELTKTSNIFDDFAALSEADRSALIMHLEDEQRHAFLSEFRAFEQQKVVVGPQQRTPEKALLAPWLDACLSTGERSRFPALYDDFSMTRKARDTLRDTMEQALNKSSSQDGVADDDLLMPSNNQNSEPQNTPSLMERLFRFFAKDH